MVCGFATACYRDRRGLWTPGLGPNLNAAVNLGRTRADDEVALKIEADCAQVLPAALD